MTRETVARRLPRILAEGVAIVTSILLAFAIDAWWDQRSVREQARELVAGLYDDFSASQAHVDQWVAGNQWIEDSLTALLSAVREQQAGAAVEVPLQAIVGSIGAPTYSPTDTTLAAAISSGQIELIRDRKLRHILALWLQQIADTREDELLIREIAVHQLVPLLSEQVRLGQAFEFERLVGSFLDPARREATETVTLHATPALEGALAERLFYTHFVVSGLAEIRDTQAEILRLLQQKLDE